MSDNLLLKASYENGILTISGRKNTWYIEYFANSWQLFKTPDQNMQPPFIGKFPSFQAAYKKAEDISHE